MSSSHDDKFKRWATHPVWQECIKDQCQNEPERLYAASYMIERNQIDKTTYGEAIKRYNGIISPARATIIKNVRTGLKNKLTLTQATMLSLDFIWNPPNHYRSRNKNKNKSNGMCASGFVFS